MEVIKNQIDELNIELTVKVAAADYEPSRKKRLSERRRNAEFKGFRKGNVPASLVERVYGDQILADAVNDVVSEALNNFMKENKANYVGEPLGSLNQPENAWIVGSDFTFLFDLATTPEVDFEVSEADEIAKYSITVTEKAKAEMKENLLKYDESKKELSEEALDNEVKEYLSNTYKQEAEYRLSRDIREYFIEKAAIKLPEDFLKRWLQYANGDKYTQEQIDAEFPAFLKDFRWQMVSDYLMKKFELKITEKEINEAARGMISYQYAMYGLSNVPEDVLNEAAQNLLQDGSQIQRIAEQAENKMVMDALKEKVSVKSKRISLDKFRELPA